MLRTLRLHIDFLEKELAVLDKRIAAAPEGKLRIYTSGNCSRWYVSFSDGRRVYLPKSQKELADVLWQKGKDIEKQIRYRRELKECQRTASVIEKLQAREVRNLGRQINTAIANDIAGFSRSEDWGNEPYTHNTYPFEGKGEKGPRGIKMRSKSEVIIALTLESFGIQYRYECAYPLFGRNVFPDFTIKRPTDGKIVLWEHCGMWDVEDYRNAAIRKINDYQASGLIPFEDFIYSIETRENHVDMDRISNMIRTFILF